MHSRYSLVPTHSANCSSSRSCAFEATDAPGDVGAGQVIRLYQTPGGITRSPRKANRMRPRGTRKVLFVVWVGVLAGVGGAVSEAGAQTPGQSSTSPAPSASTSTVPPIWTAQVVPTEDLARMINSVTDPSVADSSVPILVPSSTFAGVPSSAPQTTRALKSRKSLTKPTTTFVRLLPSVPLALSTPTGAKASNTTSRSTEKAEALSVVAVAAPATMVVRLVASTGAAGIEQRDQPTETALAQLRHCESGGRYELNTGNGYFGAYQFSASTWLRLGFSGLPHKATPAVQDQAARKLQAKSGWGQWPACARKLGLL